MEKKRLYDIEKKFTCPRNLKLLYELVILVLCAHENQ